MNQKLEKRIMQQRETEMRKRGLQQRSRNESERKGSLEGNQPPNPSPCKNVPHPLPSWGSAPVFITLLGLQFHLKKQFHMNKVLDILSSHENHRNIDKGFLMALKDSSTSKFMIMCPCQLGQPRQSSTDPISKTRFKKRGRTGGIAQIESTCLPSTRFSSQKCKK
jgi:hypothetical protein